MAKGGGKGRLSNELVAASCAAVLTVYAAGYWRTRDEARRMEAQAQERRPARAEARVAAVTAPPAIEAAPTPATPPAPPAVGNPESPAIREPETRAVEEPEAPREVPAKPPEAAVAKSPAPSTPAAAGAKSAAPATPAAAAAPSPPPSGLPAAAPPPVVHSAPLEEAAPPPAPAPPSPGPRPEGAPAWRDGTYTGWGQSYHGDIEARVTIENGRIVGAGIATCATRYPCDVIETILLQPIERQSPEVDGVSRATESADAYYAGLVEALKKAEAPAEDAATLPP